MYVGTRMILGTILSSCFDNNKDLKLWDLVEDVYISPNNEDGTEVSRKEINVDHNKNYKMHDKDITIMMNAITFKEFDKCITKETTKSIYDALVLTYEGSKKVQDAKVNLLVRKYELFHMEEDEDIETMFYRFQTLVSG
ncbi:uncharacterized protein [Cicer arietinum]|uniref:uncharacterized protein n=1 Tax=Cicer arietinum TaxID=3827 RepID=UPI003CC6A18E